MTKTQIIYTSLFGVIITLFAYILIMQPKVNASEKYLELQQEKARLIELNQTLESEKKEESDAWWVDEDAKNECIKSFEDLQKKRNQNNIQRDKEITANS
jgi:predicted Holliday junction resolvase-like endonuclease